MPIIISEFEIVPEPAPETQARRAEEPSAQRPPSPYELSLALAHVMRRDARVKAD